MKRTVQVIGLGAVGLPFAKLLNEQENLIVEGHDERITPGTSQSGECGALVNSYPNLQTADITIIALDLKTKHPGEELLSRIPNFRKIFRRGSSLWIRSTLPMEGLANLRRVFPEINDSISYSPERMAEGHPEEITSLPQLYWSSLDKERLLVKEVLHPIIPTLVWVNRASTIEFTKLMLNAYRFMHLSLGNVLAREAESFGVPYEEARAIAMLDYPRGAHLPSAGFVGGPCLRKDFDLLFTDEQGKLPPELLPFYQKPFDLVENILSQYFEDSRDDWKWEDRTVFIYGVTFKANHPSTKGSLVLESLIPQLQERGCGVIYFDPFVNPEDERFFRDRIEKHTSSEPIIILGANHVGARAFVKSLKTNFAVIDPFGLFPEARGTSMVGTFHLMRPVLREFEVEEDT